MGGLLVTGGTVVDGTGTPGRRADVRVRDGRIVAVEPRLAPDRGETVLDADGCTVAPGFIDTHTHFDPSLFWDRACDPMPQHGVTSVLVGNCSLSLAPITPDQRATMTELFCYIEDLPEAVFRACVPWSWEDYAGYLEALGAGGAAVNIATLVGHTALRMSVLGDESWDRPSSDPETQELARLLAECLEAGAFGMSTSIGFDEDRAKRPVPSRLADDAELGRLIDVLADHDRFLQFIPTPSPRALRSEVTRVTELTRARNVTSTWINIYYETSAPDLALELLDFAGELQASGLRTYPQLTPRTFDVQVNWSGGMALSRMPVAWHPMVQAPTDHKREMLHDEAWRARARAEWDATSWTMLPHKHLERIRLVSVTDPRLQRWVGTTLADLVADRGGHPSDVLADWLLENDLQPGVVGVGVNNADPDGVAAMLLHPASIIGNSDAGAHLKLMCAGGDTTLLLCRHVRERGDLSLEQAVHEMTGRQAALFGFEDRGVVAPGAHADLAVFDLDALTWENDVMVDDLPLGASRLRRPAGGYRWTVVGGVVTQADGELTSALPGQVLRR